MRQSSRGKIRLFVAMIMGVLLWDPWSVAFGAIAFPQDKVDKVCLATRAKGGILGHQSRSAPRGLPMEGYSRETLESRAVPTYRVTSPRDRNSDAAPNQRDTLYIGPGPDTLRIETDHVQDGDIVIFGQGVLLVDNARLTLSGSLVAADSGKAIFRNHAHLHFNQSYVGQYYVWLVENATFEATDATVDANGVMHFAQLHDHSVYTAKNTVFPDWTFRKVFDRATLLLEDVCHVGDIMVSDSCFVHFTRCDTLMPWFQTPDGSVIDFQFPDPDYVESFEFSDAAPGVDGIGYTFLADACSRCWWSLETFPGCSVTINNSIIRGSCLRIPGSDTVNVSDIANYAMHLDLLVPLEDRHVEYINTYVYWWNWYPMETTVFNIDACIFGEMIGRNRSETYATNCIHDGATVTLCVEDSAFLSFIDGASYAFMSSWDRATFLLVNSTVVPLWPYQSTNLAHGHSYLLAVNSYFDYIPEALDTSLVMVAAIDSPFIGLVDHAIAIFGSAWIDAGPSSAIGFDRYGVYWTPESGSTWTLIEESTTEFYNDTLAVWNTAGMNQGDYDLRLTLWDDAGDSLTAFGKMSLHTDDILLSGVLSGTDLILSWTPCWGASAYWVYGAEDPVFNPGLDAPYEYRLEELPPETATWTSDYGIGDPDTNWVYLVIAVDSSPLEMGRSNRLGEFDFGIVLP